MVLPNTTARYVDMALKIALKPGEKVVINGAVIQNTERRTTFIIHNKSNILREKDIITFEQADTPVKRIYFAIMMTYLDQTVEKTVYREFVQRIAEFINVISNEDALDKCIAILEAVNSANYYSALQLCKQLLTFEEERLNHSTVLANSIIADERVKLSVAHGRVLSNEGNVRPEDAE